MPPAPMVRPNLTTCFRTKNIEDLENTIIHSFSEVGDWILDICCGSRELSLVWHAKHLPGICIFQSEIVPSIFNKL